MNRLNEIDELLQNFNIDHDQYAMWKDNIVTQRFMLEIEMDLLETKKDYSTTGSMEAIALKAVKNGQHCETLEHVIEWKPKELELD